jgi:5-methyltetrahydropteroyltriglutamate--homocysteine methyltransferase
MSLDPGRILTTHTGSLPRPDDLIRMMWAQADGVPVDPSALGDRVAAAVREVVERQASCGIDIVNDGEMSKPSYATYVQDRLTGFGGESIQDYFFADLVDYPRSADLVAANPGRRKRSAPACTGDIAVKPDDESVAVDLRNLTAALAGVDVGRSFSSAASPGVVSLFFANQHYPNDEEYLFAIAEAMRTEYEAIAAAGVTVQVDCPDLAMGRHSAYASMDLAAFRRRIALNIEALNHAVRNIPAEQLRMHLCWGNYPGPHHHDVDLADIIDLVWQAKPRTVLLEAANPRHAHEWRLFEQVSLPDDKILCPGMVEPQSNYIEHPQLVAQRICRYADLVGRDRVMAGVDCGFSVHVGMQGIDPDVAWGKLAALAQGAELATKRLWGSA